MIPFIFFPEATDPSNCVFPLLLVLAVRECLDSTNNHHNKLQSSAAELILISLDELFSMLNSSIKNSFPSSGFTYSLPADSVELTNVTLTSLRDTVSPT